MQFTVVNGKESSKRSLQCGIPQGSVLDPILFLIYINDLFNSSNALNIFTDDSNLFFSHKDVRCLETIINNELKLVFDWLCANKLSLNVNKISYFFILIREKWLALSVYINNNPVNKKNTLNTLVFYLIPS